MPCAGASALLRALSRKLMPRVALRSYPRSRLASQMELQAMINEKKAELERLNLQHESLQRVEADQKALIEKLTNNEA